MVHRIIEPFSPSPRSRGFTRYREPRQADRVLATVMMIALMEKTSLESVEPFLEPGQGTVGTRVDVSHCSATPEGMKFRVDSELIEIDRRRLVFKVAAYDERGLIGEGTHERFIIDYDKFQTKAEDKKL